MSYFKSKYRIAEVQSNDGKTYFVPERRDFLSYRSMLPAHDPGYTTYSGAEGAITTDQNSGRQYHYIERSSD